VEKYIANLGKLIIATSVAFLIFIYYPIISIYLFPTPIQNNLSNQSWYITIPKIYAQAPIIPNVNAWDKTSYDKALEGGVAAASGFSLPGQGGTIFLFAHSSQDPWKITRLNTAFLRLNELNLGDQISITNQGKEYRYKVVDKKEVWPNEVKYLQTNSGEQLILQTCTPIGTSLKRLLVFAKPV